MQGCIKDTSRCCDYLRKYLFVKYSWPAVTPDLYTPCKPGQDTLFARIFRVFESHLINLGVVAEDKPFYNPYTHIFLYT